jgi:uncharacterized repeat protein (TIGR03803 family)
MDKSDKKVRVRTQNENSLSLAIALGFILACPVAAQTLTTLHSFTGSDGRVPFAGLITNSSGNTLYGTTQGGGSSGRGTVFAVNTDGTGFTNLHNFGAGGGNYPYAGLLLSGNTLYGTTHDGGGTVFAVNTDGTGFTNLHNFDVSGAYPAAGLILSGNTLFGTVDNGGSSGNGTVFAINTDGTGFTNLYGFTGGADGGFSTAALILSGNTLYGTASGGGISRSGTVFAVSTNGTSFTTLHGFSAGSTNSVGAGTNSDGAYPDAGLVLSGNTLYGTAAAGGSSGSGTVFAINTNGTGFTNLHNFTATYTNSFGFFTNSDGATPYAVLILTGNTLYGTTHDGGSSGRGTVFAVNTDGTGFTTLHSFTGGSEGAYPPAGLVLSGNTLYGTTQGGGSSNQGTVFSLSFIPQLTIIPSGSNAILMWPTNVAGFDYNGYTLQSTTNLAPPVWTTDAPVPVIVNGQNTITNPISGTQQFFRLSK